MLTIAFTDGTIRPWEEDEAKNDKSEPDHILCSK